MAETPRIEVVLHREFSEPVECPRYSGPPMFATSCRIKWFSDAAFAGDRFSVRVFGARLRKNGEPYNETLDRLFWGYEARTWLERAGVTEDTVANALTEAADQISERSHP